MPHRSLARLAIERGAVFYAVQLLLALGHRKLCNKELEARPLHNLQATAFSVARLHLQSASARDSTKKTL